MQQGMGAGGLMLLLASPSAGLRCGGLDKSANNMVMCDHNIVVHVRACMCARLFSPISLDHQPLLLSRPMIRHMKTRQRQDQRPTNREAEAWEGKFSNGKEPQRNLEPLFKYRSQ